jgi:alpha-L-fucosidase
LQNRTQHTQFEPTWESLKQYSIPQWFIEAKLGIFIHWGIYSVPAFDNEWYSRNMYLQGHPAFEHHQQKWGNQFQFGYKDFIPMFTGEKFDPDAWAELFKKAGARYVVPVAEHHDGFAMYDTALSEWNAVKMGPKRDVIGELSAAVRKQNMVFGVSSHRAEHWWFFNGGRAFDSDVQDPRYNDFYGPAVSVEASNVIVSEAWHSRDWTPRPTTKFLDDWLARCCELVDKYQPQFIYFDWWIEQLAFEPYLQKFAAYFYNCGSEWNKGVVLTHKFDSFPEGTAVYDLERGKSTDIRKNRWQADTSVSYKSWCFLEADEFKAPGKIVHDLVDAVSKNGNLLLNVGPKPDGTIPDEAVHCLTELGTWLTINGEAIFDAQHWHTYGEGDTPLGIGHLQERDDQPFTAADIRFMANDHALYAICLGLPEDTINIQTLGSFSSLKATAIERISMLGADEALSWVQNEDGLQITPPAQKPGDYAFTFKIELNGG